MAINLTKGQRVSVALSRVSVGLGWESSTIPGVDFDLDASCFMLNAFSRLPKDEFFVFYNNPKSPDGAVETTGDDLTGGNSDGGDDETLHVELKRVSAEIKEIVFVATIYGWAERKQNFGQVRNAYIRIYNTDTNEEIARYELDEDFSVETAIEFGRLYLSNGEWKFEAIGLGIKGGLEALVNKYK